MRTNVSRNALDDAIAEDQREQILAQGGEAEMAGLRRTNPEALFDLMASLVAGGYAARMGARES